MGPIQDSDVRSIKERLFAFELEQIKHGEYLRVSPTRLKSWPEILEQARGYHRHQKQVIELYWNSREELTIEDGLVYKGYRLVIPAKERPGIIKSLHESHIGVEGTLRSARDIV